MSKRLQITLNDDTYEKLIEMTEVLYPNKSLIIYLALEEFYASKYQDIRFNRISHSFACIPE